MSVERLREWLSLPRTAISDGVASDVWADVEMLKSRDADFYGYALHPGELYDILNRRGNRIAHLARSNLPRR
jgi:hypothetical protein